MTPVFTAIIFFLVNQQLTSVEFPEPLASLQVCEAVNEQMAANARRQNWRVVSTICASRFQPIGWEV